jgi:hypothetical protein
MSNNPTKPIDAPQAYDLRRTFETALARIQQSKEPSSRSKTPIVIRKHAVTPDAQAGEKQAVEDAARALAQLWKISPVPVLKGG